MLHIFLTVLAGFAFIGANCAVISWAINTLPDPEEDRPGVIRIGGMAVAALLIVWTLGVYGFSVARDHRADHCGPGTRYVEHHVGKRTEWQCVAKEN